ncbi:MAG: bifunctional 5,10-methylenetetrahydrofolate dehydrogenase/5,10-methenyltetrahydrofolate cyclohydrolase [Holophagales bacterium]|nr:MAG: bifunctional 5,10-methylenetetrahydrofolate dehydrogenase/5,10-methenyltetrahydrofolate cyclohydrolase [Holophagales bacterium]
MRRLLAGKPIAEALRNEAAQRASRVAERRGAPPGLVAILVGDDPASQVYVASKAKACAEVGIHGETLKLPADVTTAQLLATIDRLNSDDRVDGILVQLPLPPTMAAGPVLERIDPDKDVDGFHPVSVGRLWSGEEGFAPATPAGIVEMLRRDGVPLAGQHAVVVGRSNIVGKPMAGLLLREHCTVTLCHSRTHDLEAICRQADILVAALGRPGFLGPQHVRDGAVVIDVGINRIDDPALLERLFPGDEARRAQLATKGYSIVGDVDFARVQPKAGAITPVPGGVGLLTVGMLLLNTVRAAERRSATLISPT